MFDCLATAHNIGGQTLSLDNVFEDFARTLLVLAKRSNIVSRTFEILWTSNVWPFHHGAKHCLTKQTYWKISRLTIKFELFGETCLIVLEGAKKLWLWTLKPLPNVKRANSFGQTPKICLSNKFFDPMVESQTLRIKHTENVVGVFKTLAKRALHVNLCFTTWQNHQALFVKQISNDCPTIFDCFATIYI